MIVTNFLVLLALILAIKPVIAQAPNCQQIIRAEGLVSAKSLTAGSKFGNLIEGLGICVIGSQAAYVAFKIPTYQQLELNYYDQARVNKLTPNPPALPTDGSGKINFGSNSIVYKITNNVDITASNTPIQGSGYQIIFVTGDLNINQDLIFHRDDSQGGLVFIVKGKINILSTVRRIDAILIAEGNILSGSNDYSICTGFDPTDGGCPDNRTNPLITRDITINGSLIALNENYPVRFRRWVSGSIDQPSEIIIHQAKYLAALSKIFSQTLTITSLDTSFALNSSGTGPLPPPQPSNNLTVSPLPAIKGQLVTVSWSNQPNPTGTDGIYLYAFDAQNSSWIAKIYPRPTPPCNNTTANGTPVANGSCQFIIPNFLPNGYYEFRILSDPGNNNLAPSLISVPFLITEPGT